MPINPCVTLSGLLVLTLAACGSSGATNVESPPAAPQPSAAAPAALPAPAPAAAAAAPAAAPAEADTGFKLVSRVEAGPDGRHLVAEVTPEPGFHINLEFPWALTIAPTSPFLAGKKLVKSDAKELGAERARYEVVVPSEGSGVVDARLRLSICNDRECRTPSAPVSWKL
jgi:glucose/arabinose dehydrogenase